MALCTQSDKLQPSDSDLWPGNAFRRWANLHDETIRSMFPPDWTHANDIDVHLIREALERIGVQFNGSDDDGEQVIQICAALTVLGYCEVDQDGLMMRRVAPPTSH